MILKDKLPTVITSSVIRSTEQGESHGGVYIIDLETENVEQVLDWDTIDISWEGRGKDRGLRGITFYENSVLLAASDELYIFDRKFNKIDSFSNTYLKHCHEIFKEGKTLYLTSTGYNSIIEFDLERQVFVKAYQLRFNIVSWFINKFTRKYFGNYLFKKPTLQTFDPNVNNDLIKGDQIHINNVFVQDGRIFVSGTRINKLYEIYNDRLSFITELPFGTHNASPMNKGKVIMNNTSDDAIAILDMDKGQITKKFSIPFYDSERLQMNHVPKDHARQGFGRGLTIYREQYLIAGSSPASITIYNIDTGKRIKSVNLSMDVRNAIHGLEVWPYL